MESFALLPFILERFQFNNRLYRSVDFLTDLPDLPEGGAAAAPLAFTVN